MRKTDSYIREKWFATAIGQACMAIFISHLFLFAMYSCGQQEKKQEAMPSSPVPPKENMQAKEMLQGVWLDSETDEVMLKADGDTVFFADATIQPAYFRVVGDSIELGQNTYHITKQTENNFWFENHAGDEVRLVKHVDDSELQPDFVEQDPQIITTTEVINLDSVVYYGGQRYHWYITVNPTRYRVMRTTYTADGVAVEKVFYDNIIHVSVFKGNDRLFSRDFNKQAFAPDVPEDFLAQSILGNIRFHEADARGFHFYSTVCIPDGESCYLIDATVGYDGRLSLKLMEY